MLATAKVLNEFHAHHCGNSRQISRFAGDKLAGLAFGYYKSLAGLDAESCLQECCVSNWCDFVLVSDGSCYGIQCIDKENCHRAKGKGRSQEKAAEKGQEIGNKGNLLYF